MPRKDDYIGWMLVGYFVCMIIAAAVLLASCTTPRPGDFSPDQTKWITNNVR